MSAPDAPLRLSDEPRHPWSLLRDFARLLLLAVVLPVAVLAGLNVWQGAAAAREQYAHRLSAAADLAARDTNNFLHMHLSALRVLAEKRTEDGHLDDTGAWRVDLARLRRHYPDFNSLAVTRADGRLRLVEPAVANATSQSVADRAYFFEPKRTGHAYVSNAYRGRVTGDIPSIAMSAPLFNEGRFAGIVGGAIRIDAFPAMREQSSQTRGFEMLLLDRAETVVHASPDLPYAPLDQITRQGRDRELRKLTTAPRGRMQFLPGVLRGGADAYGVQVPLDSGWQLLVLVPQQAVVADLQRSTLVTLGLLAMVMLGVLGVAGAQMRRLGEHVRELLRRMQRFALDGGDAAPVSPRGLPLELVPMTQALNQLAARAREAYGVVTLSLDEQQRLRAELQAATRSLLTAQEDERNVISRELHDDIGQQITAIKLGATLLGEVTDSDERDQILGEIVATADETVAKLRNLSLLLRPPQLDSVGMQAAIGWHAERVFRSGRTRVELDLEDLPARPDREVELAGFRIAQEALTNVLRHAEASRVMVRLAPHDEGRALRLTITDDGHGLDPGRPHGLGMVTMRERAQQLGGSLQVHSEPGRGTVVEAVLPMHPALAR